MYKFDGEDIDCKFGNTSTANETIGSQYKFMNDSLYKCRELIDEKVLKSDLNFRFGLYHVDFFDGVILVLNKILAKNIALNGEVFVTTKVLDFLMTIFSYQVDHETPYPYCAFFTTKALNFYRSAECQIKKISFYDNAHLINEEIIDQHFVFELWKVIKRKDCKIEQVNFNYTLDDELFDRMIKEGYTEEHIVSLMNIFPPQNIICQSKILTVSALKALYSIEYDNQYFKYCNIAYDQSKFENVGIAYSVRENIYQNWEPRTVLGRFWKRFFYNFNDIFVVTNTQFYLIDEIKNLNNYLKH